MRIALDTRVVIGLAVAAALGLADLVGAVAPAPDIGQAPPWAATLAAAVAGVVTLVGVGVVVWASTRERARSTTQVGRVAVWLVVASRVVSVLATVPTAFLTGFTVPLAVWSVVVVVVTVVAIALLVTGVVEDAPAS